MTEEQTQKKQQHDLQLYISLVKAFSYPNHKIETNQTLYHYTDAPGLLGILKPEEPVLWFSRFDCLNDKSEGQDILEHFQNACELLKNSGEFDTKLLNVIMKCIPDENITIIYDQQDEIFKINPHATYEDFSNKLPIGRIKNSQSEVFMCCFSQKNDLLPMWNYYSNSSTYQGYCIGFNPGMFITKNRYAHNSNEVMIDGCKIEVIKVIYDNEEKMKIDKVQYFAHI